MADPRLQSIYMAAGRLFNRKGYADTKVAEIAADTGIATGSMYNLFTGKKAILTFVIRASLEKGYLDGDIAIPIEQENDAVLMRLFTKAGDRIFKKALNIQDESDGSRKSFIDMISGLFDLLADYLLAFGNIESNAHILKDLAKEFFPARVSALKKMEENLIEYMQTGEIRSLDYPRVHVQSILDILTWWAMNAYIAMPDILVPRETAKRIAVDLLAHAYLKEYE